MATEEPTRSEKPSPYPKRPRVSFTTVSMRTFSGDDPKVLSSPKERALSPISDANVAPEEGEVTANVESLSRLVLEDELDARSKHLEITNPSHLERVLLKQASPMRTPTAEQETSPLPENWDLYKQFKSSQAALEPKANSPELKSTSRRISPRPGAFCAASLRPAAAVPPLPRSRLSPRARSPDTVDMSVVVRSIQMGPNQDDEGDSEVPEGRKSFATFQSFEPGPEIYAVKQASRRMQEPAVRGKAMQRHQHHRSDLINSAERFREMRDQVLREAEEDDQLMDTKGQIAKKSLEGEQQQLRDLEEQVSSAEAAVEATKEELRQAKKRLLREKAQRVQLQQEKAARTCWVTQAMANTLEVRLRGASGSIKVEGGFATMSLRTRSEELGRSAWREAVRAVRLEKAEDVGSYKEATIAVEQLPELLRRLDLAFTQHFV